MTIPDKWESKEWEKVCVESPSSITDRLRVPGGWLYRCLTVSRGHDILGPMCFVPNTAHHLYIQKLEKQLEDAQEERDAALWKLKYADFDWSEPMGS